MQVLRKAVSYLSSQKAASDVHISNLEADRISEILENIIEKIRLVRIWV